MARRRGSWVLLALALAFGGSLVVNVALSARSIRAAGAVITQGQAELLRSALRSRLRELSTDPSPEFIEDFLAANASSGLRYVAISGPLRSFRAGVPLGAPEVGVEVRQDRRFQVGPRERFEVVASGPGTLRIVFEIEPQLAPELQRDAQRTLVLGSLTAVLAVLLAWAVRRSERDAGQQRRLAALGQMSAVLAHELRNPLASLKGHAQLLEESWQGSSDGPRASRIVREAERLEHVLDDLLAFAAHAPLQARSISPADLAREAAVAVAPEGKIIVSASEAPATWELDPDRFRRLLENLLQNALQATAEGAASPELAVTQRAGRLEFSVRDHGPGIDLASSSQLFEPFVTHRERGTGLGLAIVRLIAEQHGATVSVRNHPGGGANFMVTVPARAAKREGSEPWRES